MKRKKVILPLAFIIFFAIGGATFYFFGNDIQKKFFPLKYTNVPGGAIAKNEPVVTCGAGDKSCTAKNEKVMANRLDGAAAKFVSHQCNGPRACPTPNEEDAETITAAIRVYTNSPKLELIRVTGVTPIGMIYYCAEDERCWSYDTKSKKVVLVEEAANPPISSNSAEPI